MTRLPSDVITHTNFQGIFESFSCHTGRAVWLNNKNTFPSQNSRCSRAGSEQAHMHWAGTGNDGAWWNCSHLLPTLGQQNLTKSFPSIPWCTLNSCSTVLLYWWGQVLLLSEQKLHFAARQHFLILCHYLSLAKVSSTLPVSGEYYLGWYLSLTNIIFSLLLDPSLHPGSSMLPSPHLLIAPRSGQILTETNTLSTEALISLNNAPRPILKVLPVFCQEGRAALERLPERSLFLSCSF